MGESYSVLNQHQNFKFMSIYIETVTYFNFSFFSEKNFRLVFTVSLWSKVGPPYKFPCDLGYYPFLTTYGHTPFHLFALWELYKLFHVILTMTLR